eukprot:TRINITY_DN390271_c0_g1_i1.p1 TRINITY_DN390271_c0_g1~~TRINITY_DN390271_c0_g1_i1.p1  ORF type:complete len:100 (+),score=9.45 TRINITY_DN390271_c0_g1_i1:185-484(+)
MKETVNKTTRKRDDQTREFIEQSQKENRTLYLSMDNPLEGYDYIAYPYPINSWDEFCEAFDQFDKDGLVSHNFYLRDELQPEGHCRVEKTNGTSRLIEL